MGTRNRKAYYQAVTENKPRLGIAPPANVLAADLSDTLINSFFSFTGTWLLVGGAQYIASRDIDLALCAAWGGIAAGAVMLTPVLGDVLADLLSDIRQGWERGTVAKPEPEPVIVPEIHTEDEAGAARIEGEWWYRTQSHRLCCYPTPRDKHNRPLITDVRMRKVFGLALTGTPFSEREMTERVSGLSGPRFRMLQRDWRGRALYVVNNDHTGHFTVMGKLIANVIANYPTAPG